MKTKSGCEFAAELFFKPRADWQMLIEQRDQSIREEALREAARIVLEHPSMIVLSHHIMSNAILSLISTKETK